MLTRRYVSAGCIALVLIAGIVFSCRYQQKVTLAAVGDVFFARGAGRQIAKHGPDYPFADTKDIIRSADLAFCNLECTLSRRGLPQRRRLLFRADPSLAHALKRNGFDVASLANNHTLDFGRDALLDTVDAIDKAGMTSVGAGADRDDATKLRIVKRKGLRIGFLAFTDIPSCGVVRLDNKPTVAGVNADEIGGIVSRAKKHCDVLVVSFHWGIEYMKKPTMRQKMLAHKVIDSGADVVLGHHPHVLQTVEEYKSKPIIYSMGGFVWDAKIFGADNSAIYILQLSRQQCKISRTIPVKVVNCRPRRLVKSGHGH